MITQCANCYAIGECFDDGEAHICVDRATCQFRVSAIECLTCDGRGGELEWDVDGDGVWATPVCRFLPCEDCIGAGKCPGCGAPMTAEQQTAAEKDIDTFTCAIDACSWHYDADRFYDYDDYYEEEDIPYEWDDRAVNGPYSDFSEGINDFS